MLLTELTQMELLQGMAVVLSREPIFLCPLCNYAWCRRCKCDWHSFQTCDQHQREKLSSRQQVLHSWWLLQPDDQIGWCHLL